MAWVIGFFWKGVDTPANMLLALAGSLSHLVLDRFNRSKEYLLWAFRWGQQGYVWDLWPHFTTGEQWRIAFFCVGKINNLGSSRA